MHRYGVTLVLSTATQPSLDPRRGGDREFHGTSGPRKALDKPGTPTPNNRTEIVADVGGYHAMTRRFTVGLPEDFDRGRSWKDIAAELRGLPVVLCIVNTRRSARALHALMPEGTYHLSAAMCPQHRADVINDIKARLADWRAGRSSQPVQVVSTQLIEAGVDLDFPVVYRALAGLDSLAQSAGRCNREGAPTPGRL